MWQTWWGLPGPSAFIDQVLNGLRAGSNVIIALPWHAPPGLREAVGRRVHEDEQWLWRVLSLQNAVTDVRDPASFLYEEILGPISLDASPSPESLATADGMRDQVIWVEGITPDAPKVWHEWRRFVQRYARACQMMPQHERGLICCAVQGFPKNALPVSDAALSLHLWNTRIDELDMQIWVAYLLRSFNLPPLERKIRRVMIGALAGADPVLAVGLSHLELDVLLMPADFLLEDAKRRCWTRVYSAEPTWESGTVDTLEGQKIVHAAIEHLDGINGKARIEARLWQGQVAVLFPLIEQRRRYFLGRYKQSLWVPFERGDGSVVNRIEDLEIGHLYLQLRNRVDTRTENILRRLKDARNALAHLEMLESSQLKGLIRALEAG